MTAMLFNYISWHSAYVSEQTVSVMSYNMSNITADR